jgi:glutaredoxin
MMKIELLSVPNCPHVNRARDLLRACMKELDLHLDVIEIQGEYSSPTILVNGVDVMGDAGHRGASCRLDVPTRAAILRTLRQQ